MSDVKKTIAVSAITFLVTSLVILGGITLADENVYFCEDRAIAMQCYELSKYYGLPNGKCWNLDVGNKLCRSGWIEVVPDIVDIKQPEEEKIYDTNINGNGKAWQCEGIEDYSKCYSGKYVTYFGELI